MGHGEADRGRQALQNEAEAFVAQAQAMTQHAQALVQADDPAAATLLDERREALAELLGRYQRFKHARVFDPVINEGSASRAIVARRMKIECILMGECFAGYRARWAFTDLQANWAAHRADTLATTDQLLAHLAAERQSIRWLIAIDDLYAIVPATAA